MSSSEAIFAFDIYGTILNPGAIADSIEDVTKISSERAIALSKDWRKYQLEYTWRLNSMQIYEPFDIVTRSALVHAASDDKIKLEEEDTAELMDAYMKLPSWPGAMDAWKEICSVNCIRPLIFSNGTEEMVMSALQHARITPFPQAHYLCDNMILKDTQSGELGVPLSPKIYKPAKVIYEHLVLSVGMEKSPGRVWLISSNPFDIAGARAVGMNAIWVDRAGSGWTDALLGSKSGPTKIVKDLSEIAAIARELGTAV